MCNTEIMELWIASWFCLWPHSRVQISRQFTFAPGVSTVVNIRFFFTQWWGFCATIMSVLRCRTWSVIILSVNSVTPDAAGIYLHPSISHTKPLYWQRCCSVSLILLQLVNFLKQEVLQQLINAHHIGNINVIYMFMYHQSKNISFIIKFSNTTLFGEKFAASQVFGCK